MKADAYYTLDEAAELLKVHPQTLRRWIREGRLAAKQFGKQFRLSREDIEKAAEPAGRSTEEEPSALDQFSLSALAELWDNEEDSIYDDLR